MRALIRRWLVGLSAWSARPDPSNVKPSRDQLRAEVTAWAQARDLVAVDRDEFDALCGSAAAATVALADIDAEYRALLGGHA